MKRTTRAAMRMVLILIPPLAFCFLRYPNISIKIAMKIRSLNMFSPAA
jgi:hypothetical protein